MIIGIHGELGSGKTALATLLGYIFYCCGYSVMANYHLKFPYKQIDINQLESMNNVVILFDELHTLLDSRRSSSKFNMDFSYFILQTRKRSIVFIYTSQFKGAVEKRLRNVQDISILCVKHPTVFEFVIEYSGSDFLKEKVTPKANFDSVFKLYDTNEIIMPILKRKD